MRKVICLLSLTVLLLFSCNNRNTNYILNTGNLRSYFIAIRSDSGYTLKTPQGARLIIAPNSFDVPANTKVSIEVKEAYSLNDMILAGLTTESNGKPLRSAGMLYFNATANNKKIKFIKAIQATIPSRTFDETMQIFKGEVHNDSTINWVNPEKPDTPSAVRNLLVGEKLFKAFCASCHKSTKEFTGPPLAGARQRAPNPLWAYRFVEHSIEMIQYDPYARQLFKKYNSVMTQFPLLKAGEIKSIYDYCDNEANLLYGSDSNKLLKKDPAQFCGYDTFYYPKPKENIEVLPINNSDQI